MRLPLSSVQEHQSCVVLQRLQVWINEKSLLVLYHGKNNCYKFNASNVMQVLVVKSVNSSPGSSRPPPPLCRPPPTPRAAGESWR